MRTLQRRAVGWLPSRDKRWLLSGLNWKTQWPCVRHNFDRRAADGTTPAARFFRREFPDLFETVLAHVEALPRPRQRSQSMALSG
jgi:hypothetical protein